MMDQDRGGRALSDLGAEVEHDDAVADAHDGGHVVFDEEHGDAPRPDALDHGDRLGRLLGVQAGERLVEQQRARLGGERHGDSKRAQAPMREVAGALIGHRTEAEIIEDFRGAGAERPFVVTGAPGRQKHAQKRRMQTDMMGDDDIFERRHLSEDGRFLKGPHEAAARDDVRLQS